MAANHTEHHGSKTTPEQASLRNRCLNGPRHSKPTSSSGEQILNYVNERAHDAIDEKGLDAEVEARDRALVTVLAFTGVRGSEIFRAEHDNRTGRQGLRWRDIDLNEQTISVLGKNQQRQSAWLLEQAIPAVEP